MATVTFKNQLTVTLNGQLPAVGSIAPNFAATKADLSDVHLEDWRGQRVVLNIFPSVDTGVCAATVRPSTPRPPRWRTPPSSASPRTYPSPSTASAVLKV